MADGATMAVTRALRKRPQFLRDLVQSASNTAASNVSGPVDIIGAALRAVGVPVPTDAVGGSEWMARRGLTAPVQPGAAQVTGDTLALLAPFAVAAKAPQIAAGVNEGKDAAVALAKRHAEQFQRYNQALGPAGASQATVWHGSPHKFDRFDSSKIGTGEGAQAYGHGLYLAELPDVARSYSQAGDSAAPVVKNWIAEAADAGYTGPSAIDWAKSQIAQRLEVATSPGVRAKLLDAASRFDELAGGGNLYKVDLPDQQIARMLDWDKPLSQQAPEASAALQGLIKGAASVRQTPSGAWEVLGGPNASSISFLDKAQADEYVTALNRGASTMPKDAASAYLLAQRRAANDVKFGNV